MKTNVRLFAILLSLILLVSLCACAGGTGTGTKYTFYALEMGGYYVEVPRMADYYTVLNDDGTGELYWGDDNKGPISEWTADGEKLVIKAGVSVMDATLKDGILSITIETDDYVMNTVYVADGADTSSMPLISSEGSAEQEVDAEAEAKDAAGVYTSFGVKADKYGDYILDAEELDSEITLNEDGTGSLMGDGVTNEIDRWSISGTVLTMDVEGATLTAGIENGVIRYESDGITTYFAKPGADISGYDLLSQEEFRQIVSSAE